jgi:hypothetical protein
MLGSGKWLENLDYNGRFVEVSILRTSRCFTAAWESNCEALILAYSTTMDFVLAALPWTFLYNLHLRKREKVGILIAMSMGTMSAALPRLLSLRLQATPNIPNQRWECSYCQMHQAPGTWLRRTM